MAKRAERGAPSALELVADRAADIESGAWRYGAGVLLAELLSALGDDAGALALAGARPERPLDRVTMLFGIAAQQARRGLPDAARTAADAWRALPEPRFEAHAWAAEAIVRVRMGRASDAARAIDEGLAAARRDTPADDRVPFARLVDVCLAAGTVERALRIYVDLRRPTDRIDPARHAALTRALLAEGRDAAIEQLFDATPADQRRDVMPSAKLVAERAASSGKLAACRAIAARLPPYEQAELWSSVLEHAGERRDVALEAAEALASARSMQHWLAAAWLDLGRMAEADAILAQLVPPSLPWPAGRAFPQRIGPLLVRRGRAAECLAALRAAPEAGARLTGRQHSTAHPQIHEWRAALAGAPDWNTVRLGMTDAAHALGDRELEDTLFAIAGELATAERDPYEAVRWWRDIGLAYGRAAREAEADEALDRARRLAIALRGKRAGVAAKTSALTDLARAERIAGRRRRAIATARKIGKGAPRDALASELATDAAEHGDLLAARDALAIASDPGLATLALAEVLRAHLVREGVPLGLGPITITTAW